MATGYDKFKESKEALKQESDTIVLKEEVVNQEIVEETKKVETAIAKLDEQYFLEKQRLGIETMQPEDLATPTLTIIQPTNKLVDQDDRPYPRGKFFYSGDKSVHDTVNVSFLVFSKTQLPSFADKTIMQPNYIYYGAIMPGMRLFKLYLRSVGIGQAKKFNSEVVGLKKPMFALDVTLSTTFVQGDKGDYYRIEFKINGVRDNQEEIIMLEALAAQFNDEVKSGADIVSADIPF